MGNFGILFIVNELFLFLLGISVGSFLNVLIDRLPKGQTIWGRSQCDYCKKTLRWYELIPIVSYLMQGGRCRRCHRMLSVQYPLVELATGFGFILLPNMFHLLIFCSLLVIFVADLKYQIIPDSMLLLGVVGAIGEIWQNIGAGLLGALFFLLLWSITRGRGMGFGDVKLAGLLGLLLGYPRIVIALYGAFLTGAAVGVILILRGKAKPKTKIAFGPFMIFGALLATIWGARILEWWKGLL